MNDPGVSARLRGQAGDEKLFESAKAYALEYMRTIRERDVYPSADALAALEALKEKLPENPAAPQTIIETLRRVGSPATTAQTGGRYFGFVNGGAIPAAVAARWLSDAWDQNAALYVISPVSSVLEDLCEEWLVDLLGLPHGTAAGFVSGTSTATLCGLAAGRNELLRRCGWDAGARGLFGAPEIRVIAGAQAHSTVYKALSLLGLGKERLALVPTDSQGRIKADLVPEMDNRTMLILQAGNVNSGAFDPFEPICEKAGKAGAWVHIDGAFGLWAAASPRHRHLASGIERADSWSADAHKTLNAPYDNGIVFCRDREALTRAMHMTGSYIAYSDKRDGMRYTADMSRRARGVELWATLKALGRTGVAGLVDELCEKAALFAEGLRKEGFAIRNEVCFNQVLASCESPEVTQATLDGIQASAECWCGGAAWESEPVIRISVCSFMTTREDIERSIRAFVKAREKARREASARASLPAGAPLRTFAVEATTMNTQSAVQEVGTGSVYNFTVDSIDGMPVPLGTFRGNALLIVNVASKCGFTYQYKALEDLYQKYKDKGFVILGFPSNDFFGQEPGTNEEIKRFCSLTYGVSFPLFTKISVRGRNTHALYRYLTGKDTDPRFAGRITWNFNKFLVSRNGEIMARFSPREEPGSPAVATAVEKALAS